MLSKIKIKMTNGIGNNLYFITKNFFYFVIWIWSVILSKSNYASLTIVKRGPEDVGKAFEYIFKNWIPKSIYIPTGAPGFIYYDDSFFSIFNKNGYEGNLKATVYVPIKPFIIKRIFKFFRFI